jgi:hypothetical protein
MPQHSYNDQYQANNYLPTQTTGQSPPKRHLPIAPKQMVYNEWAAILAHQDEMDQALRKQEKIHNIEFKNRYREELEQ